MGKSIRELGCKPGDKIRCVAIIEPGLLFWRGYHVGGVYSVDRKGDFVGDNGEEQSGIYALWERVTPDDDGWGEWEAWEGTAAHVWRDGPDIMVKCEAGAIYARHRKPRRISGTIAIDADGKPIDGTFERGDA